MTLKDKQNDTQEGRKKRNPEALVITADEGRMLNEDIC